jgi:hypothetical protein
MPKRRLSLAICLIGGVDVHLNPAAAHRRGPGTALTQEARLQFCYVDGARSNSFVM